MHASVQVAGGAPLALRESDSLDGTGRALGAGSHIHWDGTSEVAHAVLGGADAVEAGCSASDLARGA